MVLVAAGVALTTGIAWVASRRRDIGLRTQYALLVTMVLANLTLTRLFGPLLLVPTMIVTWTIVFQAHPTAAIRRFATGLSVLALVVPPLLELAGVIPASCVFANGAHVALALMPAAFIRGLRDGLERAQTHQMVEAWHFRRLGDDLLRAAARPT